MTGAIGAIGKPPITVKQKQVKQRACPGLASTTPMHIDRGESSGGKPKREGGISQCWIC
jgi:hypothetical protein